MLLISRKVSKNKNLQTKLYFISVQPISYASFLNADGYLLKNVYNRFRIIKCTFKYCLQIK